ncbi:MAG: hypothetical protein DI535_21190 [Citrobacter freundii]|nr:MAG: hypothetical protein DI535_21190 [Citrobacter freundii]
MTDFNKTPAVSIITIVYNGLPYLKQCVESVLSQDFTDWELIISDDGSNDGSRDYITGLNDPRIKFFLQEKNLGIFGNLNFAFSQIKAGICQLLCQDDYFTDNTSLSRVVDFWKKAPESVGFARFNHGALAEKQLYAFQKSYLPRVIPSENADLLFYIFANIPGNLSDVSLRSSLVKDAGGFRTDLPYAGDFEFWVRAAQITDFAIEDQTVVEVRRHQGTASNYLNRKGELFKQKKQIIEILFKRLRVQYPDALFALRLHGTLQYDSLPRDSAFKALLRGGGPYYKAFNKAAAGAAFSFGPVANLLLYVLSAGGRIGRVYTAKKLLKKSNRYN